MSRLSGRLAAGVLGGGLAGLGGHASDPSSVEPAGNCALRTRPAPVPLVEAKQGPPTLLIGLIAGGAVALILLVGIGALAIWMATRSHAAAGRWRRPPPGRGTGEWSGWGPCCCSSSRRRCYLRASTASHGRSAGGRQAGAAKRLGDSFGRLVPPGLAEERPVRKLPRLRSRGGGDHAGPAHGPRPADQGRHGLHQGPGGQRPRGVARGSSCGSTGRHRLCRHQPPRGQPAPGGARRRRPIPRRAHVRPRVTRRLPERPGPGTGSSPIAPRWSPRSARGTATWRSSRSIRSQNPPVADRPRRPSPSPPRRCRC